LGSPRVGTNELLLSKDARLEKRTDKSVDLTVSTAATDSL